MAIYMVILTSKLEYVKYINCHEQINEQFSSADNMDMMKNNRMCRMRDYMDTMGQEYAILSSYSAQNYDVNIDYSIIL